MSAPVNTPRSGIATASTPRRYTLGDRLMRHRAYREVVHLLDRHVGRLERRLERCYEYDAILIEQAAAR